MSISRKVRLVTENDALTVDCGRPTRRCIQQAAGQQRLHHRQADSGGSGHALPVHETHQRHLGAGRAAGASRKPQLRSEYSVYTKTISNSEGEVPPYGLDIHYNIISVCAGSCY